MGVPFDALYEIGMCTCTRIRLRLRLRSRLRLFVNEVMPFLTSRSSSQHTHNATEMHGGGWGGGHGTRLCLGVSSSPSAYTTWPIHPSLPTRCDHAHAHHAHADTTMFKRYPRRYRRFSFFWYFSPPQKKGAGGVGAQQQQQKSAANAAAAAARQVLNEINTAMTLKRFRTCGIVVF